MLHKILRMFILLVMSNSLMAGEVPTGAPDELNDPDAWNRCKNTTTIQGVYERSSHLPPKSS